MKKIIGYLRVGDSAAVFRGMLTLAAGASSARVISLASIPLLTRIYSPEDYGVLALFVSLLSILLPFSNFKYSSAIPLPRTDAVAINVLALSFIIAVTVSAIIAGALFFWGETALQFFGAVQLAEWWWLVALGVLGSACYELLSLWSTRKRRYALIAKTQFYQALIGNLVKVAFGLLMLRPLGLLIGQFLAQTCGVGSLFKGSLQELRSNASAVSKQRIWFVAKYYRQFAYFRLPSQFALSLSAQAPIFMMAALFSKEATGQLSLAMMAVVLPINLIGGAISKAFYGEVAAVGRKDLNRVRKITIDTQKKLFIIGVPVATLVVVFSESLFVKVFGQEWQVAGRFATILAPFILLQFTSNPLMQVLNILGSQFIFLLINLVRLLGLAVLFLLVTRFAFLTEFELVGALSFYLTTYHMVMTFFVIYIVNYSAKY